MSSPRQPYRKYDDGLTKQQRYVQRQVISYIVINREKVNAASAKWKRERREKEKLRKAEAATIESPEAATIKSAEWQMTSNVPDSMVVEHDTPDPLSDVLDIRVEPEDTPENIELRCEVEDLFNDWRSDIDENLRKYNKCWNMARGWKCRKPFEESSLEKFFKRKFTSSNDVIRKLEQVLKILAVTSPDYNLTIERLLWVSGKQAEMDCIFNAFYTRGPE